MSGSKCAFTCTAPESCTSLLLSGSFATSVAPSITAFYFDPPRRQSSWSTPTLTGLAVPTLRRSTFGYAMFLGANLVIGPPSTEVEYRVVANGMAEASWLR
jgi:hypothetical protein